MKKILILLFISVLVLKVNAQEEKPITKGHIIVGGDLTFKTDKYEEESSGRIDKKDRYHFNTDLSVGYFVFDQFALGLKVGLVLNREIIYNTGPNEIAIDYGLQLKPFLRYYTSFGIFVEADIGYGFRTSGYIANEDLTIDFKTFTWSSGLGYNFFLNRNLAIEPKVLYKRWSRNIGEQVAKEKTSGIYLIIGFQIYLYAKKK